MKRTLEMKIRFTRGELDALTKKARKSGFSREGFSRRILNGAVVKETPPRRGAHADSGGAARGL